MREPAFDLDQLASVLPVLDGHAIDPSTTDTVARDASGRARRARPLRAGDPGWLAKQTAKRVPIDRPPLLEVAFERLARAVGTLRRLDALAATPGGVRHVVVLAVAYVASGPELHDRWATTGGLDAWLGLVCAGDEERDSWSQAGDEGAWLAAAGNYGGALLEAARASYRALPRDADRGVPDRGRLRLDVVMDVVTRAVATATEHVARVRAMYGHSRRDALLHGLLRGPAVAFTLREVAGVLGVDKDTVANRVAVVRSAAGHWLVPRDELAALLARAAPANDTAAAALSG